MPRPRVLPYIVLGLLNKNGVMSGKDMIAEFKNEISEFWTVSHSQLYPELQRMTDEGQIEVVNDVQNRKVINYAITKKGQTDLREWLATPITAKNDELTSLKMYFIADRHDPLLQQILKQAADLHEQKVAHLKQRQKLLFEETSAIEENYGHYLILSRAVEREASHLAWLKKHIE